MWLVVVRHARPVVCNRHAHKRPLTPCVQPDNRTCRGVLDGVAHEVCEHLDDEACIDAHEKNLFRGLDDDTVLARLVREMRYSGFEDVIDELGVQGELDGAFIEMCDGEQILDHIDEPKRVMVHVIQKRAPLPGRKTAGIIA